MIWELIETGKNREKRALRIIGASFFALATYILIQSVRTLSLQSHPDTSMLGIIWLVLTFLVMLSLAFGKKRVGTKLDNPVLLTEGRVTLADAYLAGSVFIGVALNALFGFWWADPIAALVIVFYGFKEGHRGTRHCSCCC